MQLYMQAGVQTFIFMTLLSMNCILLHLCTVRLFIQFVVVTNKRNETTNIVFFHVLRRKLAL